MTCMDVFLLAIIAYRLFYTITWNYISLIFQVSDFGDVRGGD